MIYDSLIMSLTLFRWIFTEMGDMFDRFVPDESAMTFYNLSYGPYDIGGK